MAKKLNKAYIVSSVPKDLVQANTTSVSYNYDVVKDGNIIQFTRKTNNWTLNKEVAVKSLEKSKNTYQADITATITKFQKPT